MEQLEIGVVTINYDENGEVITAEFKPTMKVDLDESLKDQLNKLEDGTDQDRIKYNADLVLAGWFHKMNEIELADRFKYDVASEVVSCLKYDNNKVKTCIIRYIFKEL